MWYIEEAVCYFEEAVCYFEEAVCYFGEAVCYFEEAVCYFEEAVCYFEEGDVYLLTFKTCVSHGIFMFIDSTKCQSQPRIKICTSMWAR